MKIRNRQLNKDPKKSRWLKSVGDIPVMIPRSDGSLTVIGQAKLLSGDAGAIMRVDIGDSYAGGLITQYLNEGNKAALSINVNPLPAVHDKETEMNYSVENQIPKKHALEQELSSLLNRYSAESVSGTPDFILAGYILGTLKAYNEAVSKRAEWRGEFTDFDPREKAI